MGRLHHALRAAAQGIGTKEYRDEVLSDSPFIYLRLEDESGTTSADSSGNGNDGDYINSPTLGQPALLDSGDSSVGLDGSWISVDHNWDGSGDFTIEMWIRTSVNTRQMIFFDRENGTGHGNRVFLSINNTTTDNLREGYIRFFTRDSSVIQEDTGFDTGISDGSPHHLVAKRSGDQCKVFVDAVEVLSFTGADGSVHDFGDPFVIGRSSDSLDEFKGDLDEIAFYRSALSDNRVQTHYDVGRGV